MSPEIEEGASGALSEEAETATATIFALLAARWGVDFRQYKKATIARRLTRRMGLLGLSSLQDFAARLANDDDELSEVYQDLLVGVTEFFRDDAAFRGLAQVAHECVAAQLAIEEGDDVLPLRVWVAGCATGEEAYATAMVFLEAYRSANASPDVKIFATDVNAELVARAARGSFDGASIRRVARHVAARVPSAAADDESAANRVAREPEPLAPGDQEDLASRYFVSAGEEHWTATAALRDLLVFARHDVTRDPPFLRLDLVCCRNLLMFLRAPAQQRALSMFHAALRPEGVLFLGPSESVAPLDKYFTPLDEGARLFRKSAQARGPSSVGGIPSPATGAGKLASHRPPQSWRASSMREPHAVNDQSDAGSLALTQLVKRFASPSVLIDFEGRVQRTFVGGGRLLQAGDGDFSGRLIDMLDGELRAAVETATRRAWRTGDTAVFKSVDAQLDGADSNLDVEVAPLLMDPENRESFPLLVSFIPRDPPPLQPPDSRREMASQNAAVKALEAELATAEDKLRWALEELSDANHRQDLAQSELVASSESLQTTREELSSIHEELVTVTAEYQTKLAELQALVADFDSLLNHSQVHALFLDSELSVRRFSPGAAKLFHLREQDIGRSLSDMSHDLDYRPFLEDVQSAIDAGETSQREVESSSGESYLLQIVPHDSPQPSGFAGDNPSGRTLRSVTAGAETEHDSHGVLITLLDITQLRELRRVERRLQLIVQATPDLIATLDTHGRLKSLNEGGRALLGVGDELPASLSAVQPAWAASALAEALPTALRDGSWLGESALLGHDGQEVPVSLLLSTHRDINRREDFVAVIARDISEAKAHARKLLEADQRKDLFLATLSHELRNPLHALHTSTELLQRRGVAVLDRALPVLRRQLDSLERLLEDLLDISRITGGQITLDRQRVSLTRSLGVAIETVRASHPGRQVRVHVEERVLLDADPMRLQQMLANLLSNAMKYSEPTTEVEVRIERLGDTARITIIDYGVGLETAQLQSIFAPFVRESRGEAPGLGLGLALVRQLAELHGGTVNARSEGLGHGSQFVLCLPGARAAPAESRPSTSKESPPQPSDARRPAAPPDDEAQESKGKRILIVDDNSDAVLMMQELLEENGWLVMTALNGAEGWRHLQQSAPDVALIDIALPDITGHELARRAAREGCRPQWLFALSGYGQPSDVRASLDAGFDEHLVKPVDLGRLAALVQRAPHGSTRPGDATTAT